MKKILSLLLVAVMLLSMFALASCGEDEPKLPIDETDGTGDGAVSGNEGGDETDSGDEKEEVELEESGLEKQYFSDFIPDENAQYRGMVGFGANKAGVDFDNFRVVSANKKDIIYEEFTEITELNSLIYTGYVGELADWVIGADELDETNKQLTYSNESTADSALIMGNKEWGPYRINIKVKLADETEVAYIYFCVQDEKNYYVLEIGADNNTCLRINKVTDGVSELDSELPYTAELGKWIAASVSIEYDVIKVYMAGTEYLRVGGTSSDEPLETNKFGVGQWNTQFYVDNYTITDAETGEVIYCQDFENDDDFVSKCTFGNRNGGAYTYTEGDWVIKEVEGLDGTTTKVLSYEGSYSTYGAMILFPDINIPEDCTGYKVYMDAYRVAGSGSGEFTAIVWGYDSDTDYWNYNYGGWNGMGAVQKIAGGSKTNYTIDTLIGMETGVWQTAEVVVYNYAIYSYYNGSFIQLHWID